MACCLIALMLLAQCMATLRRWGAFWGIVPVPQGIAYDTAYVRARRMLARREIRLGVAALVAIELGALGSWVYIDHRHHIAMIVADSWERVTGHKVIYAGFCDNSGKDHQIRLVLDSGRASQHIVE